MIIEHNKLDIQKRLISNIQNREINIQVQKLWNKNNNNIQLHVKDSETQRLTSSNYPPLHITSHNPFHPHEYEYPQAPQSGK